MLGQRRPVILDTDIGTDVDDVVALTELLRADTVDLLAVTTVYVNAALRARMVRAVLSAAGRAEIPVGVGADQPLLRRDALYWAGWEGEGLLADEADDAPAAPHAVDLLIREIMARPGEVTVVAIGPLTNVALALLREPALASALRRLVIMGGRVERRADQLGERHAEHNVRCDPEAAQIVLTCGAPITLVPLDVTTQTLIRREALDDLRGGDALARLVADQLDRYFVHVGREWTHMHDPLATSDVARPGFLRAVPMRVQVECAGQLTRGQLVAQRHDGPHEAGLVDVALGVDAQGFEAWLPRCLGGR
jgi:purine nucleosidase